MTENNRRSRSNLPKSDAQQRYIEIGELAVLEQIRRDATLLDQSSIPIGPFARLQAGAVAERDAKTRGTLSNLFGNQRAFQSATMEFALNAGRWLDEITYPKPDDYSDAEAWLDAFLLGQSERGPKHGADPAISYASVWALWLSAVPYGLWSSQISASSMDEHAKWIRHLDALFASVLDHFALTLRLGTQSSDLASGMASLIEGVWLNQCLSLDHPCDASKPISSSLRRAGLMLWQGAVVDACSAMPTAKAEKR